MILAHESAHKHYGDNFSLLAIELLRNLYWWNPLVSLLTKDVSELIEARCDHRASKLFPENQYQMQLAALMHSAQVDLSNNLSSAVISKNPNMRRIQYLSEKIKMNLRSKIYITTLLTVITFVLAIPVSSLTAMASSPTNEEVANNRFSMDFDMIPISMASKFISEFLKLESVSIDEAISKTVLTNFKLTNTTLKELSDQTNNNWAIENNTLKLTPRPGTVNNQLFNDKEITLARDSQTTSMTHEQSSELGALIDIQITRKSSTNDSRNKKNVEMAVWTHFNKASTIKMEGFWEATLQVKEHGEKALISFDIFDVSESRKLIASPRLFTIYGQEATIEWSEPEDHNVIWTINVTPNKTTNPNMN